MVNKNRHFVSNFCEIQTDMQGNMYVFLHSQVNKGKQVKELFDWITSFFNIKSLNNLELCHGINRKYPACVYMYFGIHLVECGRIQYSIRSSNSLIEYCILPHSTQCIPKSIYTQGGYFLYLLHLTFKQWLLNGRFQCTC